MIDALEIFPWDDNFSTGIPEVDDQHKQLVGLLNQLASHMTYSSDIGELGLIFDQLKGYAILHFRDEETIWTEHFAGDSMVHDHQREHASFVQEVGRLQGESEEKPFDEVIVTIAGFLTHWLALHILESDKRMAHAYHGVGQGFSTEEAKRYADEMMSGATRMMIDTIMAMYDKLANRTVQFSREIGKRKRVELKLKQALDDLRHTKELAEASHGAASAFLADVRQEFRQPAQDLLDVARDMRGEGQAGPASGHLDQLDAAVGRLFAVLESLPDPSGRSTPGVRG